MSVNGSFSRLDYGAEGVKGTKKRKPKPAVGLAPTTRGRRSEMTDSGKSLITLPKNDELAGCMGRTFLTSDSFVS